MVSHGGDGWWKDRAASKGEDCMSSPGSSVPRLAPRPRRESGEGSAWEGRPVPSGSVEQCVHVCILESLLRLPF